MRIESSYFLEYLLPAHSAAALHIYFPVPLVEVEPPAKIAVRHRIALCRRQLAVVDKDFRNVTPEVIDIPTPA